MINKIYNKHEYRNQPFSDMENIEVTIRNKDTGEILYQNDSKAGIVITVEEIKSWQAVKHPDGSLKDLEIEGQQQHLFWGNRVHVAHAYARLQISIKEFFQEHNIMSLMMQYVKERENDNHPIN